MQPLICADCKWHIKSNQSSPVANYDRCASSVVINLVTGEAKYTYCESMRVSNGCCGIQAKLFELNQDDEVSNGE